MPAQWTGVLIGDIHNAGLTIQTVAKKADLHPKYVSRVLNGEEEAPRAEKKLRDALEELIEEKRESV